MNETTIPASLKLILSERLARALERQFTLEGTAYLEMRLPPDLFLEATHVVDALENGGINAPPNPEVGREWLAKMATAVRNMPDDGTHDMRSNAVMFACADLPGWLFNKDTQQRAMAKFDFFPAVAYIRQVLEEFQRPFMRQLRTLRSLLKRGPEGMPALAFPRPPRTRPSLAYVREVVQTLSSDVGEREQQEREAVRAGGPERVNAVVADGEMLLILEDQERQGVITVAGQTRLAHLRAQRAG